MSIKDIYRSHPSDHFMLTPRAIYHLGKKSMVQPLKPILFQYQVKFVLCEMCVTQGSDRDRDKDQEFDCFQTLSRKANSLSRNISLFWQRIWYKSPTQEKFAEIVQRIYNTIIVYLCKVSWKTTNCPGKNSCWVKDLNIKIKKIHHHIIVKWRKLL